VGHADAPQYLKFRFIISTNNREYKKDLSLQLEALEIIKQKNLFKNNAITSRIYPNVANAYAANGNMDLAYLYADLTLKAKDSLAKERNMLFVSGVQHKIDVEKHNSELQKKELEVKQQKLYRNSFLGGFTVMLLFAVVFFAQRNKIKKGKKQSDELLLNILPIDIAEELKLKGSAEAKQFDEVTVMFTDFKGFTKISEKLTPAELVAEIDACFKEFDAIISKYTIEKIKTIGDSYMCVGGLPKSNSTHATDIVSAAIEFQEFMKEHLAQTLKSGKEPFEMRIGIHTGSVVAGIVGLKKFAYDIWGDTVNIASRMESSGEEGKINISGTTYQHIKDRFTCAYRGKIQAKNKGEIDMYFVERAC
jgi:class 3 adenylate cyclase